MGQARREVGFWGAVLQLKVRDILTVEAGSALLLGGGFAYWLYVSGTAGSRESLATNYLVVIAALLSIAFAGLALVVSLMSSEYMRLLQSGDGGVLAFFRPFMLAIGFQVFSILSTLFYLGFAATLPPDPESTRGLVEPWLFGVASVLFVGSCLELVVLTRSILLHAKLRSHAAEVIELAAEKRRKNGTGR